METQIPLSDLNKDLRLRQSTTYDFELEHSNIYEEIEMKTFSKFPIEIQELGSDYKGTTNVEYKTNNRSIEMTSSSEYQQTSTSSNFSSMN